MTKDNVYGLWGSHKKESNTDKKESRHRFTSISPAYNQAAHLSKSFRPIERVHVFFVIAYHFSVN